MELKDKIKTGFVITCILLFFIFLITHMVKREIARRKHMEKLRIRGEEGERDTAGYLKKVRGRKELFFNLYIPGYSGSGSQNTTEIDMVMIHEKGIFVIENKNYSGWIYGDEDDTNWLQILGNGKKRYFYSPVRQNRNHIRYLKQLLDPVLEETVPFISVITFNQDARLKRIRLRSEDTIVCSSPKVKRYIHRYLWWKRKRIKKDKMKEMKRILEMHADVAKKVKKEHVRNIRHYKKK